MKPRILVAGLGNTGVDLLRKLSSQWAVSGLEQDGAAVDRARLSVDPTGPGVTIHQGDATSALVLKRAAPEGAQGAVAVLGSDEANLEFLRLAREVLSIERGYALLYDEINEARYFEAGIDLVSQDRACASILVTRVQGGHRVAAGIGLGQGEIMEVEVLAGSPVVGRTLAELHPRRWLVGAVYRDRTLIVPHGQTELQAGDKVLLVGEPDILPSIATLIRAGESEFPLQWGANLGMLSLPGFEGIFDEVLYLLKSTSADRLELIGDGTDTRQWQPLLERCEADGVPFQQCAIADTGTKNLCLDGAEHDIGVLVLPPAPLLLRHKLGLARSQVQRILSRVSAPVLVARKSFPYQRVVLGLADLPFPATAAQLAIDVARALKVELHIAVGQQPDIVEGTERRAEMEARRRVVERLAGMYHVRPHTTVLTGNPVRELIAFSKGSDLMVVPYPRGQVGSFARPNVWLYLIHQAPCSVLILPE